MKLNKYNRESILDRIEKLKEKKSTLTGARKSYTSKELKEVNDKYHKASTQGKNEDKAVKDLEIANSLVVAWDIDIIMIDDNIEFLKKILINNEY
jgi:hypothetical protein